MSKKIKTQFAIRKLTTGTAAVLLSLGILSNNALPIVSAAIQETPSEQVAGTDPEIVTSDTQDNSQTSDIDIDVDVSKSDEQLSVDKTTIEEKVELKDTPASSPTIETDNSSSQEAVDSEENKKKPTVDTNSLDEIKQFMEDLDKNHLLGIAGAFHLFGQNVSIQNGTHVAGNVAADKLNVNGSNFGTNNNANTNLTYGDIYYVNSIDQISNGAFTADNKIVVFGPEIEYRPKPNESHRLEVMVNGDWVTLDQVKADQVIKAEELIDFKKELDKLNDKANDFSSQTQTEGVVADFSDQNNRYIDISNVSATENTVYVTIDAQYITSDRPIHIKGISTEAGGPNIVLNVVNTSRGDLNVSTQVKLTYADGSSHGSSETNPLHNKVLWNFGTNVSQVTIANQSPFMGSILAPNATITAKVNVDGNIIGQTVIVDGGETHRWDLTHPPTNSKPDQVPTTPIKPIPPRPQPSEPEEPENPSEPEKPENPTEPVEPTNPQPSEPQITNPDSTTSPMLPIYPIIPQPSTPVQPSAPEQSNPEEPTNPVTPSTPEDTTYPENSLQPPTSQAPTNPYMNLLSNSSSTDHEKVELHDEDTKKVTSAVHTASSNKEETIAPLAQKVSSKSTQESKADNTTLPAAGGKQEQATSIFGLLSIALVAFATFFGVKTKSDN